MSRARETGHIDPLAPRSFHGAKVPDTPLLSLVTPAYEAMPYLGEAIASAELLAEHVAFEHVVADGASADGSFEVLAAANYVRGISQPDEGLYSALNWALEHAQGRYIQWLNADDYLCPKFTRRAVELLEDNENIDFVLGNTVFVSADGEVEETWRYDPYRTSDLWSQTEGYFFNINSAVYRTDVLRRVGEFDQASYPVAADLDFELRLLMSDVDLVALDEPAYVFRRHSGSLTSGQSAEETVMRTGWRLFERWSENQQLDSALRRAFYRRALELRLGWLLKRLSKARQRRAALSEIAKMLIAEPVDSLRAATSWLEKKVSRGFVPMRVDSQRRRRSRTKAAASSAP